MPFSEEQLFNTFKDILPALGDDLSWRYEERSNALLSEFARDKKKRVFSALQMRLTDEWDRKSIKRVPDELKSQLKDFTKLSKDQIILSVAATDDSPTFVALWWPWGHGGTFSVRLLAFEQGYELKPEKLNIFSRLKLLF